MVVGGKTPTTAKTISIQFITYRKIGHIINGQPNGRRPFGCPLIILNFSLSALNPNKAGWMLENQAKKLSSYSYLASFY